MYPILFIHSSFYGDLGGFRLLAIVKKAAVDMNAHISEPLLLLLLEIHPEMGLLEHMAIPFHFF